MTQDLVTVEKADQIGWLTLNRPDSLNAMDENMKTAMIEALAEVEFDDDVRVVVLRGAGRSPCRQDVNAGMSMLLDLSALWRCTEG